MNNEIILLLLPITEKDTILKYIYLIFKKKNKITIFLQIYYGRLIIYSILRFSPFNSSNNSAMVARRSA